MTLNINDVDNERLNVDQPAVTEPRSKNNCKCIKRIPTSSSQLCHWEGQCFRNNNVSKVNEEHYGRNQDTQRMFFEADDDYEVLYNVLVEYSIFIKRFSLSGKCLAWP